MNSKIVFIFAEKNNNFWKYLAGVNQPSTPLITSWCNLELKVVDASLVTCGTWGFQISCVVESSGNCSYFSLKYWFVGTKYRLAKSCIWVTCFNRLTFSWPSKYPAETWHLCFHKVAYSDHVLGFWRKRHIGSDSSSNLSINMLSFGLLLSEWYSPSLIQWQFFILADDGRNICSLPRAKFRVTSYGSNTCGLCFCRWLIIKLPLCLALSDWHEVWIMLSVCLDWNLCVLPFDLC